MATVLCPHCGRPSLSGAAFCSSCGGPVPLPAGTVLHGYELLKHIKTGGMGSVYAATTDLGGEFVVKEMLNRHVSASDRQQAIEAFEREAKILRTLRHRSIPRVTDHFEEAGRWYLVMDQVDGEDLEERLSRTKFGRLPAMVVRNITVQVCDVLTYLHSHQPPIVFRDLKPPNIMTDPQGKVYLVDFGIAKVWQPRQAGTLIGTPGYAAPEQYQGYASPQSDIYALGATAYHLLTGDDPRAHQAFGLWQWGSLPVEAVDWVPVLEKALALREQDRFLSASKMKQAILALGASTPPSISPAAPGSGFTNPLLPVRLGLLVAKYPVTNLEYHEFVKTTGYQPPQHWVSGAPPAGLELHPVVWVSVDDARAYCRWAGVRLPEEEEWLATAIPAAIPDGRPWPWGFNFEPRGNFDRRTTSAVNEYPEGAGPHGHEDLAGNVWEWTATTTPDGLYVVKGGSYYGPQPLTARGAYPRQTRNAIIGFRVCQ